MFRFAYLAAGTVPLYDSGRKLIRTHIGREYYSVTAGIPVFGAQCVAAYRDVTVFDLVFRHFLRQFLQFLPCVYAVLGVIGIKLTEVFVFAFVKLRKLLAVLFCQGRECVVKINIRIKPCLRAFSGKGKTSGSKKFACVFFVSKLLRRRLIFLFLVILV